MKQSLFHLVDRNCVRSGLWSIGTVVNINVVNRDRGQSGPWSISTWSIGTVVNINVVNRDRGQSGPWSISMWSIGTIVNRNRGQSGPWSILTWSNGTLPCLALLFACCVWAIQHTAPLRHFLQYCIYKK